MRPPDYDLSIDKTGRINQVRVTSSAVDPDRAAVPDLAPVTRRARAAAAPPDHDRAAPADPDKAAAPDRAPGLAPGEPAVSGRSDRTYVLLCLPDNASRSLPVPNSEQRE